ncbi:MAG TPA: 16S rRNA (cytosine(1402)-N(4))-methyltransferase RsmH [Oscillospiraceae bacterium]|nr:16S rRNA (cytosine(1402)-N(4))-methyltransferase RsmH [Oscillospiraceae bacterium]
MDFNHKSVMLEESIEGLAIRPNGIYVDCTAGGAGHSVEIAKKLEKGILIALDRDPDAIKVAGERLREYRCAQVVRASFVDIERVLGGFGMEKVDGVLMDLGVSSFQLDNPERGFSYNTDAPLDMRMSKDGLSAHDVVNSYSEQDLTRILFEYGEERFSRSIAGNIVAARENAPIETTLQLAEIIKTSMPAAARRDKNPSKKSFQAIRMEVNGELDALSNGLDSAFKLLSSGGRLVVITFHSLEDRLVKQRFVSWCKGCVCPPEFPICICDKKPEARFVNKKPIVASQQELSENKRSKSAKLRILEKL